MGRGLAVLSCATPRTLLAHAGSQEGPVVTVQSGGFLHTSPYVLHLLHCPHSSFPVWPAETAVCVHHPQWETFRIFFNVVGHASCFTPYNLKASFSKLKQSSGRTSFSTLPTWWVHQRQRFHCGALEYLLQVSVFTVGGNKFHILDHNIFNKDIVFAVNLGRIRGKVSILKCQAHKFSKEVPKWLLF